MERGEGVFDFIPLSSQPLSPFHFIFSQFLVEAEQWESSCSEAQLPTWVKLPQKATGSIGCSDHDIVKFRIMCGGILRKVTAMVFPRPVSGFLKALIGKASWDKAVSGKGVQVNWFFFKYHYSKLKSSATQWIGSQAKIPRCLCGWTRSSWPNSNIKRRHTEGGSKDWLSGRNTRDLVWSSSDKSRKAESHL